MCSRDDTPPYENSDWDEASLSYVGRPIEFGGGDIGHGFDPDLAEPPIPQYEDSSGPLINPDTVTFPAWTGWSKEKADRLAAEMPKPEPQPNFYISPFVEPLLKGWLTDFIMQYQDYPRNDDDSFSYALDECRKLFQKLS